MKKKSLVSRILAILQGGDEAKLTRFENKLGKYFNKQISMRKEEIETLKEKITDATDALNDAVVNVDVASIQGTDSADSYCVSYVRRVSDKLTAIEELEERISVLTDEIARLEKLRSLIYSVEEPA